MRRMRRRRQRRLKRRKNRRIRKVGRKSKMKFSIDYWLETFLADPLCFATRVCNCSNLY